MWDWGCVYTVLHESDTFCSNMDPVQFLPFCLTCKHRNPIRDAPKPRFDKRMASMQMRLIDCLAKRKKNKNKYGIRDEIILARNSVTGLFSRLVLQSVFVSDSGQRSGMKSNPTSCKPGFTCYKNGSCIPNQWSCSKIQLLLRTCLR